MRFTERPASDHGSDEANTLESPFLESSEPAAPSRSLGFAEWGEAVSPFSELPRELPESEADRLVTEILSELRDESFNEAIAFLSEETEQAVGERFTDEAPFRSEERERFAESFLSGVGFEAEQYLNTLESGLTGLDLASFTDEQLDAKLDEFDPQTGELTPAGEEFIGGLIRKAKKAIKFVAKGVGKVAGAVVKGVGKVAGTFLGPVLNKLKALVRPLLKRVLSFAIGRLPAKLQPAARTLAAKLKLGEAEAGTDEMAHSPANLADPEMLAEDFDAALAEAIAYADEGEGEANSEDFAGETSERDGRQLERLAEARGRLIDTLRTGDQAAVGPAVEQFIPLLLGALKLGISLIGRPKVVGFLAGFIGKLIGNWVGPQLSGPLSKAIVDTGLRLVMLEAEEESAEHDSEAAPVAMASVIEDTVRRFSEQEDYIFENDELTQLAAAEAFSQAVASHFPPKFVRSDLRQAATLDGTFVTRRPRSLRTFRKYSRVPEIVVTPQIADALPSFGGATLGRALRAAGVTFPMKARIHVYQSAPGTTLAGIARSDRSLASGVGYVPSSFHPLTPAAAGLLLREPGLGVAVSHEFMASPNRIAVGQRFYALRPVGGGAPVDVPMRSARMAAARLAPGGSRLTVDRRHGLVTIRLAFSEPEAQRLASAIREGRGHGALMKALVEAYRTIDPRPVRASALHETSEVFENMQAGIPQRSLRMPGRLGRHLRRWVLPALTQWAKANAEAFARAAAHPESGVTVKIRLTSATGVGGSPSAAAPKITISVAPGLR